jgi:two-component system, chemotaxis family, sensor kinase CheA
MEKYRALFVEESREHLSELSRLLVTLESAADKGPLIDEIFRHAHSIKGMAGSMSYDPIAALAHRMEDVVDLRRRGEADVTKELIDCLLRGVDALVAQVTSVADGGAPAEQAELVRELGAHAKKPDAVPAPAATPAPSAAASSAVAPSPEQLVVRVRIAESSSAPGVRAFLVHRRLAELASVVEAEPTAEQLKLGQMVGNDLRIVISGHVTQAAVAQALAGLSDLENILIEPRRMLAADEPAKAPTEAPPAAHAAPKVSAADPDSLKNLSTVRVRTEVLDDLIDSVGELFIARGRLQTMLANEVRPDLRAALDGLSARIRQIHDQVLAVRMMPMRTLTDRYPRLVRDLSRSLGKDAELEVQGGEIELDRAILDNLDALFIHVLRNACDHGLEPADVRRQAGKPPVGKIVVTAQRDRDMVVVTTRDDGRGLDPEALKAKAIEKGLLSAELASTMSAREAYFLVCLPGFSTKTEVSDVSGRGVGMDAVRSKLEALGGSLDIESEVGRGTTIVFRLPLSLAIVPVLLVEAARRIFALPVAKVVSVREQGGDIIRQAGGASYLSFRHALVPVLDLAQLLRLPQTAARLAEHVVVIEDGRDLSALGVERIIGYHEAVVKPLGDPLDRLEWFSGAAVLGDGQPILILDLTHAMRPRPASAA